jgi:microsomal dipeptidase-like Zn-dependent dipeptidase
MNKLGLAIDLSHAGDRTALDTCEQSERPVFITHAGARGPSFDPVAYVDGLENPTENFANICGWLVQHGYDDADIRAVLGGNIYRALQSIWVSPG